MPFLVTCDSPACKGMAVVPDCVCPPGPQGHQDSCIAADMDAALNCPDPEATGCCGRDHHHVNDSPGGPGVSDRGITITYYGQTVNLGLSQIGESQ